MIKKKKKRIAFIYCPLSYFCNFSFNVSFSRTNSSSFSRVTINSFFNVSVSAESGPLAPIKRRTNSVALLGFSASSYKATKAPRRRIRNHKKFLKIKRRTNVL